MNYLDDILIFVRICEYHQEERNDLKKIKTKNHKFVAIVRDLYYRLQALPLMFLFWILIIVWKYRIEKFRTKLFRNRQKLDNIWYFSSYLKGTKYKRQQSELRKLERELLDIEEKLKEDEERYAKQKELFDKYLNKVFDPSIGR